jgi:hypothetical protein
LLQERIGPAAAVTAHGARQVQAALFNKVRVPSQEEADLISSLNAARDKLDARVALLNRALDLREELYFGLDLDQAVDAVRELRRDCARMRP